MTWSLSQTGSVLACRSSAFAGQGPTGGNLAAPVKLKPAASMSASLARQAASPSQCAQRKPCARRRNKKGNLHHSNWSFDGRKQRMLLVCASAESSSAPGADAGAGSTGEGKPKVADRSDFKEWDKTTTRLTESSTFCFLLLMLPQILKNANYLMSGNPAPIGSLPWMGYTTGLLGNMLLLSYFSGKREGAAVLVQAVGVISTFVLLAQIYLARFMPAEAFWPLSALVAAALAVNASNYGGVLPASLWAAWLDFTGVLGMAVLPQVLWSTFGGGSSLLPGSIAGAVGMVVVLAGRLGKLSEEARRAWGNVSAWTATLLFMFMPVPQLVANFTSRSSLAGVSVLTTLLAMTGNSLMVPRALFTRDLIWFTGSTWGALFFGWGVLLSLYMGQAVTQWFFLTATVIFFGYLGFIFTRDAGVHGLSSPNDSIGQILSGSS